MSQEEKLNATKNDSIEIHQEVLDRFAAMLENVDFNAQLATLGIRRLQFSRRKSALKELRAMYVGLWKLALNRSFPGKSVELFDKFLDASGVNSKKKRLHLEKFRELLKEREALIAELNQ